MQQNLNVAIYCRLSREDGNEISQSIESQKQLLIEYVNKKGWNVFDTYIDDGYSGTDFNRPAFQKLLNDIKINKINIIVTKDLSRLGRNYIQTGYYTETYFPTHNVRFIAINDNYDSTNEENNDFIPFKNIINEWYAKDISKKIKFVLHNKAKIGEPKNTIFPVFGYKYNDAYERIIDQETALIVKLIFQEYIKTASSLKVAKFLTANKIKKPAYYNAIKYNYNKEKILALPEKLLYNWTPAGVRAILCNEAYLGTYITLARKTKSFKNHKIEINKDCYKFENKYEPIIDQDTFKTASKLLKRTRSGTIPIEENQYKGIIICGNCTKALKFERKKSKGKYNYFRYFCNNKSCNKANSIQKKYLDKIINHELSILKSIILSKEEEFLKLLTNLKKEPTNYQNDLTIELDKYIVRNNEIDSYIQKLIEANVKKVVPQSTFDLMMKRYTNEKKELENRIDELNNLFLKENNCINGISKLSTKINIIKYLNNDLLQDFRLINKIIDSIIIESANVEKKEYFVKIKYIVIDDIIKEFINCEDSHICKNI